MKLSGRPGEDFLCALSSSQEIKFLSGSNIWAEEKVLVTLIND